MNTEIIYTYTDKLGYLKATTAVFPGEWNEEEFTQFMFRKWNSEISNNDYYFVPGVIGLPDLQTEMDNFPSTVDHVFHKFVLARPTEKEPTTDWNKEHFQMAGWALARCNWSYLEYAEKLVGDRPVKNGFKGRCDVYRAEADIRSPIRRGYSRS